MILPMNGTDAPRMDQVAPTAPATPGAMAGRRRRRRRRTPLERFRQEFNQAARSAIDDNTFAGRPGFTARRRNHSRAGVTIRGARCVIGRSHRGIRRRRFEKRSCRGQPGWSLGCRCIACFSPCQFLGVGCIDYHRWRLKPGPMPGEIIGENAHKAASISVDPGASRVEALKWLCYAAVFITAANLTRRTGAKRGLTLVVMAALVGGILTIIHGLLGLENGWDFTNQVSLAHPGLSHRCSMPTTSLAI